MSKSARFVLLVSLLAGPVGSATAGPLEDLLPPPVRQAEKRSLGDPNDPRRQVAFQTQGIAGAAFSPDGKLLVTGSGYQGVSWWDVRTGRSLDQAAQLNHQEGLTAAFTPDGKQVIMASWGGHQQGHPVNVWEAAKRRQLRSLDDDVNDTPFTAAAVSPDGKTIAFGAGPGRRTENSNIILWDLATGDEIGQIPDLVKPAPAPGRHQVMVYYRALTWSPDGRTLAAMLDGRILLIEVSVGKVRAELTFTTTPEERAEHRGSTIGALAFSPNGRALAAGCGDGAIRRFDLRTGRELTPFSGHSGPITALCWKPDGKQILSYSLDGQLFTWRARPASEWKPKAGELTEEGLDELWGVLRGDDPLDLFGCVQTLAAHPAQTVPFLRKRVTPAPKGDAERIERLVADMKGNYNTRRKAVNQLRKIGAAALPALQKSQEMGGYDELSQRLMFELGNLAPPTNTVRAVRAVRILERIGNPVALKFLKELADGAAESPVTSAAKSAVERLGKAKPDNPADKVDLWETLASDDSIAAYRVVRSIAGRPASVTEVCGKLKEAIRKGAFNDDSKRIEKLIGDLDSDQFEVREKANKELKSLGSVAVTAMRKALAEKVGLEPKRRLEALVAAAGKAPPPEMLRAGRVLEALELAGGSEARQALEALAKEARSAWLRQAVNASLWRLRAVAAAVKSSPTARK
jgi:WD40 repeat protein